MEKMKIVASSADGFTLSSRGQYPAIAVITDTKFHETEPLVSVCIDWVSKGSYTNGQRKKMVARTMVSLLRSIVASERRKAKQLTHTESNQ